MTWREKFHPLVESTKQAVSKARAGSREEQGPLAIALAGGGARASFQIGALAYLYDYEEVVPDIFTGTSAGAILASVLAQYSDPEGQRDALRKVEAIWSNMHSSSDMFEELAWFSKLRTHLPTWMKVVSLRQESHRRSLTQSIQAAFSDMFGKKEEAQVAASTEVKAVSPIESLTTLWEGARATTDLQQIIRGFGSEASAFRPGPVVQELLAPEVFDPLRLAASSTTLRISVVGLESGKLRYVTARGELHDATDQPLELPAVDFVDAITASCAIPGVFPPVELASEHYVDGGIRANLPTDIAYTLGAGRVIAIVSGAEGPSAVESFTGGDLLEIIMRSSAGIMPDELENLQIRLARAQGAIVIDPVIDVHDTLTVDPGLIAIATDYGWMRAQDIMTGADDQTQQLTHDIIDMRRHLWALEDRLFAPVTEAPELLEENPAGDLEQLGELKLHLRSLLERVPADYLPEGAEAWWQTWEKHPYSIDETPTWLSQASASWRSSAEACTRRA